MNVVYGCLLAFGQSNQMSGSEQLRRQSEIIIQQFTQLTAFSSWACVDEVQLNFQTHHPQGLVKIGDDFYVSSVEITVPPERLDPPLNGLDRTTGEGIGYLFHFDAKGELRDTVTLGDGPIYHPGGIDYDGEFIWVPVAEYRPNSRSIIYRVRPESLNIDEVFRFDDHIGGLAYNRGHHTLHGVSWGGRKFYNWNPEHGDSWDELTDVPGASMRMNGSHYIDFQDCYFLEDNYMLCSGLNNYKIPNIGRVALGGLELVDLELQVAVHQIPVMLYSHTMRPMTQNPFYVELHDDRLRFYFLPDDNESTLYICDVSG